MPPGAGHRRPVGQARCRPRHRGDVEVQLEAVTVAAQASVVDELQAIRASGIEHVFVVDAVFNRPESHAAAICEEILRRGLKISFTGYFVPRGDLPELPALLKRAGCDAVELGTDSLSDPVLERLAKGFTADEAMEYSRRLAAAGIKQCHNLIFGCPGETEATIRESTARMDALAPTAVIAMIGLRVFPGTPLWRLGGGDVAPAPADPTALLEPTFFVEEAVAQTVVATVAGLVEARPNWICPIPRGLNSTTERARPCTEISEPWGWPGLPSDWLTPSLRPQIIRQDSR